MKNLRIPIAVGAVLLFVSTALWAHGNNGRAHVHFVQDGDRITALSQEIASGASVEKDLTVRVRSYVRVGVSVDGDLAEVASISSQCVSGCKWWNWRSNYDVQMTTTIPADYSIGDISGELRVCAVRHNGSCRNELGVLPTTVTVLGAGGDGNPDADLDPELGAIDTDGDGIWDDAESIIEDAVTAANGSEAVRAASTQLVHAMQDVVRNLDAEPEVFAEFYDDRLRARECLTYIARSSGLSANDIVSILQNTRVSFYAYSDVRDRRTSEAIEALEDTSWYPIDIDTDIQRQRLCADLGIL